MYIIMCNITIGLPCMHMRNIDVIMYEILQLYDVT